MPAEWEKHAGTLISWPANAETWPGERLYRVEKVYRQLIKHITTTEHLHIIASDESAFERCSRALNETGCKPGQFTIHRISGNDVWARDYGPIFVKSKTENDWAITDWDYNAWGGKYPPFDSDDAIPQFFADKLKLPAFKPGMILEGGSIDVNGNGVLLTTESVLLNPNRNPDLTKSDIEVRLKQFLGVEKIIWLKDGLAGDDTDGHIDDLSRFVNEKTIITMVAEDKESVNYDVLQENLEILKSSVDQFGKPFNIIPIPLPETRIEGTTVDGSEHVPASYANFYFINKAVLLPVYDPRYDEKTIQVFKELLPDRKIIPVPCADLVWGQGSIHCITQQLYGF